MAETDSFYAAGIVSRFPARHAEINHYCPAEASGTKLVEG